ncbi:MAG: MarR family transcriptional regulator [Cyanosarcina radialis HA8281-LM2]|nr:MarR family transcriptional regulator [Cyanosarcina radialis HA8281-LM2]
MYYGWIKYFSGDRLEKAGFVRKVRSPSDRRQAIIQPN